MKRVIWKENRGNRLDDGGQKTEDRGKRTDDRRQRTDYPAIALTEAQTFPMLSYSRQELQRRR